MAIAPERGLTDFKCPACRARQPLQNECRRCKADLSLTVSVRRRLEHLLAELNQLSLNDAQHTAVKKEILLLAPTSLKD